MSLINASSYENLNAVSANGMRQRNPTKFFNTFISSDRRGQMNGGFYHCPAGFGDDNQKFFVLNQDVVYFIPLYVKKYWAKYTQVKDKNGQEYPSCIAFGWDDKVKKIEGAKTEYIIAGYLWDKDKKNIVKHQEDMEENEIHAGDPVMIYFRCKGIKCNCAFNFLKRVNEAAKNLSPLSDNPTFETNVINPRRFLIKATIGQSEPIHNRRFKIFDFYPDMQLPDELVLKILDASNNKHLEDFNKQFDKTEEIKSGVTVNSESDVPSAPITQKVEEVDVPDMSADHNPGDSFNIDLNF